MSYNNCGYRKCIKWISSGDKKQYTTTITADPSASSLDQSIAKITNLFKRLLSTEETVLPRHFFPYLSSLSTITYIPRFTHRGMGAETKVAFGVAEASELLALLFTDFQLPGGVVSVIFESRLLSSTQLFATMKITLQMQSTISRVIYLTGNWHIENLGTQLQIDSLQITDKI